MFRIEAGDRRYASIKDMIAIGGVLGISEDDVMRLAGYDDDYLYGTFPVLQEAVNVTSDPYKNEMLHVTDPEELEKIVDMIRLKLRKNKKETD